MQEVREVIMGHFPSAHITGSTPLKGGMSGTFVFQVNMNVGGDEKTVVVKKGMKVPPEIEGYRRLQTTSLAQFLPQIYANGYDWMIMESFPTIGTLRKVVEEALLPEDEMLRIFQGVLQSKLELWRNNRAAGQGHSEDMIRREHSNTLETFLRLVDDVRYLPMRVNGVKYPALEDFLGRLGQFVFHLNGDTPRVLSHGDLKGDNIVVLQDGGYRYIDLEWVGWCDWVASLVRMARWRTSLFATMPVEPEFQTTSDELIINFSVDFPRICHALEGVAYSAGEKFAEEIGDTTWRERYNLYLAACRLRDATLLEKRGKPFSLLLPLLGLAILDVYEGAH